MMTSKYFTLFVTFFVLFSCQKEKISTRDFPRIDIYNDIVQNELGVTLKAKIFTVGTFDIIRKGFVWSAK